MWPSNKKSLETPSLEQAIQLVRNIVRKISLGFFTVQSL